MATDATNKLCGCRRCLPVEQDDLHVCAHTGLETRTRPEDIVTLNGDRINTLTGVVVDQGLGTRDRDTVVLGEEGVKEQDFEAFVTGEFNAHTVATRVAAPKFKAPARMARQERPVLGRQRPPKKNKRGALWRVSASSLVAILSTAPHTTAVQLDPLTGIQQQQLAAHLQRLLDVVDETVHRNVELLSVLTLLVLATLQKPMRCGHKTNINQAFAIQGQKLIPDKFLTKGFNRTVVKLAQDIVAQHTRLLFDVQTSASDLRLNRRSR